MIYLVSCWIFIIILGVEVTSGEGCVVLQFRLTKSALEILLQFLMLVYETTALLLYACNVLFTVCQWQCSYFQIRGTAGNCLSSNFTSKHSSFWTTSSFSFFPHWTACMQLRTFFNWLPIDFYYHVTLLEASTTSWLVMADQHLWLKLHVWCDWENIAWHVVLLSSWTHRLCSIILALVWRSHHPWLAIAW